MKVAFWVVLLEFFMNKILMWFSELYDDVKFLAHKARTRQDWQNLPQVEGYDYPLGGRPFTPEQIAALEKTPRINKLNPHDINDHSGINDRLNPTNTNFNGPAGINNAFVNGTGNGFHGGGFNG